MKSRVFVVQETDRNILPAEKFGQLQVILTYNDIERGAPHICSKLAKAMDGMKPYDYVLCIGDPLAIGLAIHVALKQCGLINVLRWDKHKYVYYNETVENYE